MADHDFVVEIVHQITPDEAGRICAGSKHTLYLLDDMSRIGMSVRCWACEQPFGVAGECDGEAGSVRPQSARERIGR
jgi:hypothetical protein